MDFEVVTGDGTMYAGEIKERSEEEVRIRRIETTGKTLVVPKDLVVDGRKRAITGLSLQKCSFPGIEVLILSEALMAIHLENRSFPDLKELQVAKESRFFWTDGKMLVQTMQRRKGMLLNSLVAGNQDKEPVVIPENVKYIGGVAFQDTICTEIIFPKGISILEHAFLRSEYAKIHPVLWEGMQLRGLLTDLDTLTLPRGISCYGYAQTGTRVRKVLAPSLQEAQEFLKGFGEVETRPDEIEFTDPKIVITREDIEELGRWFVITLPEGMEGLCTKDRVIYTSDGEELVRYPQVLDADRFTVPEGVVRIGRQAFRYCGNLKSLRFPTTLREIGERAVTELNLEELVLPEGLRILRKGALAGCRVPEVILPRSVKILEAGCLYGARAIRLWASQVPKLTQALTEIRTKTGKKQRIWMDVRLDIVSEEAEEKVTTWWIPGHEEKTKQAYETLFGLGGLNLDSYFVMVMGEDGPRKGQMLFSLSQVMEGEKKEALLEELRKSWALRLAKEMIATGNLEDFRKLLEMDVLTDKWKKDLLKLCNSQEGRMTFAAYLMEASKGQEKKKFVL